MDVYFAHRFAYEEFKTAIPKSSYVLHKCDNPGCVKPEHLFLGTQTDNMRDSTQKGRHAKNYNQGEKNHRARVTKKQVLAIRKAAGSYSKIAAHYGITKFIVWAIKNKNTWKHV